MEDVEILPHPDFFTYVLLDNLQELISCTEKPVTTEWLATPLQSQERLWLSFPVRPSWSLSLCTFYDIASHFVLIYSSFQRARVHSVPRISGDHWQRNYFTFCTFCIAQHASHIYCITPNHRASLHCPFQSVLPCTRFLISSIPGPTY